VITWKGQGTVVSSNELPTTGVLSWQVRVISHVGHASWVCFGIIEPKYLSSWGDGDWMPSYSFCTCCDGYPKGSPRWDGTARGAAVTGDVFTCTADMTAGRITIVGPRGVNMTRALPASKYVLYFTVSSRDSLGLALENAFYCSKTQALAETTTKATALLSPPAKKRREESQLLGVLWKNVNAAAKMEMVDRGDLLWIGDLPPELLSMIISWVPPVQLVRVVPLVCKYVFSSLNF